MIGSALPQVRIDAQQRNPQTSYHRGKCPVCDSPMLVSDTRRDAPCTSCYKEMK